MPYSDPWLKRWPENQLPSEPRKRIPELQRALLDWQRLHGRRDLPWQVRDPYAIWISEVMLQQTQVATGRVRFPIWMQAFPTLTALASAPQAQVLKAWEGLGYYARARNLWRAAQLMQERHGGVFPRDRADRLALPGIGASTASAIAAFAWGEREAIFDANVARVWARWWGDRPLPDAPAEQQRFWWGWAQAVTPKEPEAVRTWTQAVMDLGATVCTARQANCAQCPLRGTCRAYALGDPSRWPAPKPKVAKKPWVIRWAWVEHAGKIAVVQRPAGAPWEGMWGLPEISEGRAPGVLLLSGRQALSHRAVTWSVERPKGRWRDRAWTWVSPAEFLALALPGPLRTWREHWRASDAR